MRVRHPCGEYPIVAPPAADAEPDTDDRYLSLAVLRELRALGPRRLAAGTGSVQVATPADDDAIDDGPDDATVPITRNVTAPEATP